MIVLHLSEDVVIDLRVLKWMHDHFKSLFIKSDFLVLVIDSGKEPSIESHERK